MNYKPFIIFGGLIIIGFGIFVVASGGYYPIATVNGRFIWHRDFRADYRAALSYYDKVVRSDDAFAATFPQRGSEIFEEATLTELVENTLVRAEAERELGADLPALIAVKVKQFDTDRSFQEAAVALYGLKFTDVREAILIPQAERDMLRSRLFLKGKTLEGWLVEAKENAHVRMFSRRFMWNGSEAKVNK